MGSILVDDAMGSHTPEDGRLPLLSPGTHQHRLEKRFHGWVELQGDHPNRLMKQSLAREVSHGAPCQELGCAKLSLKNTEMDPQSGLLLQGSGSRRRTAGTGGAQEPCKPELEALKEGREPEEPPGC